MSTCPSCGLTLPDNPDLPASPFHASPECWRQYGELAAYTLTLSRDTFIHQTAIDCYEAQHPGEPGKPIAAVFGLVGLYLVSEKGYSGLQVQRVHMILGTRHLALPTLIAPTFLGSLTVADVLAAPLSTREAAIQRWAKSVWDAWSTEQQKIRAYTLQGLSL